jgi:penicillin-insensitive murein endopeptidase
VAWHEGDPIPTGPEPSPDDHHAEGDEGEPEDEDSEGDDEELGEATTDENGCIARGAGLPPYCWHTQARSPLASMPQDEIARRVKHELASLGPMSLGQPFRGKLYNGIPFPTGEHWRLTDPGHAWGTPETVDSILRAFDRVYRKFPDSEPIVVGHLSAKSGGHLRPHKSHQSGRDVDLSYFYTTKKDWYAVANAKNLDRERTWELVKAFLEDPNTEMILIDSSLQKPLREYALAKGEDADFIDRVFQLGGKSPRPLIRHVKGHATHIHVRFFSPVATESARLAENYLPKPPPPPAREGKPGKHDPACQVKGPRPKHCDEGYVLHKARGGDTLDALARRYGTTPDAIRAANGLRGSALKERHIYRIPRAGGGSSTASKQPSTSTRSRGSSTTPDVRHAKPADAKPARPNDAKPGKAKATESKPAEAKPGPTKPAPAKSPEARPTDTKPTTAKHPTAKPANPRPGDKRSK